MPCDATPCTAPDAGGSDNADSGNSGGSGGGGAGGSTDACTKYCEGAAYANCLNFAQCSIQCNQFRSQFPGCAAEFEAYLGCRAKDAYWSCDSSGVPEVHPATACSQEQSALAECGLGPTSDGGTTCSSELHGLDCSDVVTADAEFDQCLHGTCCAETNTCLADAGCSAMLTCIFECQKSGGDIGTCGPECTKCAGDTAMTPFLELSGCTQSCP